MRSLADKIVDAAGDLQRLKSGWYPNQADLADAVGLENWSILGDPDSQGQILCGVSINHPALGSRPITTSNLLWISDDQKIARTLSRWYRLGTRSAPSAAEPSPEDPEVDSVSMLPR